MKILKAIRQLITDPLGAALICVGGAVAIWYYEVGQPPAGVPNAKPGAEHRTVQQAITDRGSDSRRPESPAATTTDRARKSRNAPGRTAGSRPEDAWKRRATVQSDADVEETKETAKPPVTPTQVAAADRSQPRPTVKEGKPTSSSPESVLESRGLTKVGTFYVVATEAEIKKEFDAIVPIYNVMEVAYNQFQAIVMAEVNFNRLDIERIATTTRIRELEIVNSNLAQSKIVEDRIQLRENQAEHERLRVYETELIGQVAIARKALVSDAKKQAVHDEFMKLRDQFLGASKEIRPTVDKARNEYAELEKDPAVKDAVGVLAGESSSPIRLGPSKGMSNIIANLVRAERMLSYNPDAYRRGNRAKSKTKKK